MTGWEARTWRWFTTRVGYLLSTDTALARHFAPVSGGADV